MSGSMNVTFSSCRYVSVFLECVMVRRPAAGSRSSAGILHGCQVVDRHREHVDSKHLFPIVTLLKCVVTKVVLFSIVAFKTLTFHKVV